jgi:EpsI family protein
MKFAVVIALAVILSGGLFGNYLRYGQPTATEAPKFELIPYESGLYSGEERRYSEQSYRVLQADTTTLRLYLDETGERYWLFVAYFSSQAYGRQIHSPRNCLPGGGWNIDSSETYQLELSDSQTAPVNRLIIGRDGSRQVMLYWFQTRAGVIANEYGLKLDLVKSALAFRSTDAAFIRVTATIHDDDIEDATERAAGLLRNLHDNIMTAMPFDN